MKSILTATALVEGTAGLALATMPSLLVNLLLGTPLSDTTSIVLGRLAGAALMTIAIACWLSRKETQSSAIVKAMFGYNIFAISLLIYAAIIKDLSGPGLWPVVIVHTGLLAWSLSVLLRPSGQPAT